MNEHMNEYKNIAVKSWTMTVLTLSVALASLLAAGAYRYSVFHSNDMAVPTITVSGEGEASALPDIASITFTIDQTSLSVKDAQKRVEDTMKKVSNSLKDLSVDSKDIKTDNSSVSPRYTYPQVVCLENPCPSASPKLEGYDVSETVTVTVRKIDAAGDVLAVLGKNEVKNVQGPNFSIEHNEDLLKIARAEAIEKAETKAKETAKALGKSLGDIKTYTEGGYTPYPMMYAKAMDVSGSLASERVTLAQGETKIKLSVSIVYVLR